MFLTSKKPFKGECPGYWIKDSLKKAGIDTNQFTAHFSRGASSSRASARGVPIADILKVANWSSRSTFERFYCRSEGPDNYTSAVLQSEHSSMSCALNVPLVSTVPCILHLLHSPLPDFVRGESVNSSVG